MKKLLFIFLLVVLSSCVQQSKYEMALETIDSLKMANELLLKQNDELLNGEDRLTKFVELYNRERNYLKAYDAYNTLKIKFPESRYIIDNKTILSNIESKAFAIMDSIDKVRKDSIRLANINKLGVWNVGEWEDDFGKPTGRRYVYTDVFGEFSNTATAGSRLRVRLLITKSSYSDYINYQWSFDEYNNGVEEDYNIYRGYVKVVNRTAQKVYIGENWTVSCKDEDGDKKHLVDDLLTEEEGLYEITTINDRTEYRFSINTNYINNALIKAGFKGFE